MPLDFAKAVPARIEAVLAILGIGPIAKCSIPIAFYRSPIRIPMHRWRSGPQAGAASGSALRRRLFYLGPPQRG